MEQFSEEELDTISTLSLNIFDQIMLMDLSPVEMIEEAKKRVSFINDKYRDQVFKHLEESIEVVSKAM